MKAIVSFSIQAILAASACGEVLFTDLGGETGDVDLSYDGGEIVVAEDGSGNGYGNGNTGNLAITDTGGGLVGSNATNVFFGRFLWAPGNPLDYINISTTVGGGRISFHSDNNADQGGTRVRLFDTTGAPVPNLDIDPAPIGTTLVVFRIEMSGPDRAGDETVKIWYNPDSFSDLVAGINPSGTGVVDLFDATTHRGFGIHNPQIGGDGGITQYDNLVFGDTAADVLPGLDTGPLEITMFDHDAEADTFRITWRSTPGASYGLFYSTNLQSFTTDIDDSIDSQGELTVYPPLGDPPFSNPTSEPGPRSEKLFFRVQKN